jgi:hypothetical protein
MALSFLLDENMPGQLWHAIQQHNAQGVNVLDVLHKGHSLGPPYSTLDPDLLLWCEANGRVLISSDRNTMPAHFMAHLQAGHHSPGLLLMRPTWTIPAVVDSLVLYDQLCDPQDLVDQIEFIP